MVQGPVRDQPTRATPPRWKTRGGDPGVLGEKPWSRLTPPRPSGRPFAATRMRHSRNDRYSPLIVSTVASVRRRNRYQVVRRVHLRRIVNIDAARFIETCERPPFQPAGFA